MDGQKAQPCTAGMGLLCLCCRKGKPWRTGKNSSQGTGKTCVYPKSIVVPAPALESPLLKAEFTPGHTQHPLGTRPWRVRQSWKLEYKIPPPMLTACRDSI